MFKLNNLFKLVKKRKTIGRGGSRGGTSGKGSKGQKARSGGSVHPVFEGGQMPMSRRLPKRGFNNKRFQKDIEIIGLDQLEIKFNNGDVIDKSVLAERGLIKGRTGSLLKVLGGKSFTKKLTVKADAFSGSALETIKRLGGEATLITER